MPSIIRALFGCLCLLLSTSAFGQYKLHLDILPRTALVKVDGDIHDLGKQEKPGKLSLPIENGTYTIEIWHPQMEPLKDTIVIDGADKNYYKGLRKISKDYEAFLETLKPEKKRLNKKTLGSTALNLIGWAGVFYYNKGKENDLLERYRLTGRNYLTAINSDIISSLNAEYQSLEEEIQEMQRQRNLRRTIGIPVMAGISAYTVFYLRKHTRAFKARKEAYQAGEPFTLQLSDVMISPAAAGLTFKF